MANLIVKTSIELTLNGKVYDYDQTHTVASVTSVFDRVINVDSATVSNLATIAAENGGSAFKDINFIDIENLDTVNSCTIGYKDTSGDTVYFPLDAGRSKKLYNTKLNVSESGAAFSAFTDWDTVTAQFDTDDGNLKVFICQVTP